MHVLHFIGLTGIGGIERQFQRFIVHFRDHRGQYPGCNHAALVYQPPLHPELQADLTAGCERVHYFKTAWPDLLCPPLLRPRRVQRLFADHAYDVLVVQSIIRSRTQLRTIGRFPGLRLFYDHGWSTQRNADARALAAFDGFIANSRATRRTLARRFGVPEDRIRVLPNSCPEPPAGFDRERERRCARQRLGLAPSDRVALCLGRCVFLKGFTVAVEAMRHVPEPDIKLLVVGDGKAAPVLRRLVDRYGLDGRVVCAGHSSRPAEMYAAADLFLLPSCREPFGIVLLEAAAAGLPVIANDIDGIRDILPDATCGYLVPPRARPEAFPYIDPRSIPALVYHPQRDDLAPPLFPDPAELAGLIRDAFRRPDEAAGRARMLATRVRSEFTVRRYTDGLHGIIAGFLPAGTSLPAGGTSPGRGPHA